jgi:hypothetical protein
VKDFFANMNFPRWVIVIMLTSSAVLGWFVFDRKQRLSEVERELRRVPQLVREIQELGLRLDELQQAERKEKFKVQDDPDTYIRSVAAHDAVRLGQIDITPSTKPSGPGIEDRKFRIKPADRTSSFRRVQVGNFLYQLEAETQRVRVTSLKLEPVQRLKPGDTGNDLWTFEAEITSRQAVEE